MLDAAVEKKLALLRSSTPRQQSLRGNTLAHVGISDTWSTSRIAKQLEFYNWPKQVAQLQSDVQVHRQDILHRILQCVKVGPNVDAIADDGTLAVTSCLKSMETTEYLRQLQQYRVYVLRSQGRGADFQGQYFSPVATAPRRQQRPPHLQQVRCKKCFLCCKYFF